VTEPTPEQQKEVMDKFGLTEKEARVFVLLNEAETLLAELMSENNPGSDIGNIVWRETHIIEMFRGLYRQLGIFVLRRNYPEGWGHLPPPQDDDQE